MWSQHFFDLYKFVESFENLVNQIFLLHIKRIQNKRNEIAVFFQNLDGLGRGCKGIHSLDTQLFQTWHIRLEVSLDYWVQLCVVGLNFIMSKILDDNRK